MESSGCGLDSSSEHSQSCDIQEAKNGPDAENCHEQVKERGQVPGNSTGLVVRPELLAEILNKKKMELLHSPEVKDFIAQQQSKLSSKAHVTEYNKKGTKDSSDSDTCDSQKSGPSNLSSPMR